MELKNIKGNTFYIKGGTNTGVYLFENKEALIIDPGLIGLRPKRIINMFDENNIKLKYIINTHEHDDHYGACNQFRDHCNDVCIISSEDAKLYIEKPHLFAKYITGGKSNKFLMEKLKIKSTDKLNIDKTVNEGSMLLNDVLFEIIEFKGHTQGSIGILTKDKVLFVGDLLIGEDMLKKYDFLFLFDVEKQMDSLNKLKKLDFDCLVLGHSKKIITKQESYNVIDSHIEAIQKYLNQVRNYLKTPMKLEDLLKDIIVDNSLDCNYKEYHFFKSSLVSIISYLADLDEIDYLIKSGELLYYTKTE